MDIGTLDSLRVVLDPIGQAGVALALMVVMALINSLRKSFDLFADHFAQAKTRKALIPLNELEDSEFKSLGEVDRQAFQIRTGKLSRRGGTGRFHRWRPTPFAAEGIVSGRKGGQIKCPSGISPCLGYS